MSSTSYPTPNKASGLVQYGLTALAGGGNPGATLVFRGNNIFKTVVTAADSAQMPPSEPNMAIDVTNYTATSMRLFVNQNEPTALFEVPPVTVFAAGAFINIATGVTAIIVCGVAGTWTLKN